MIRRGTKVRKENLESSDEIQFGIESTDEYLLTKVFKENPKCADCECGGKH